MQSVGKSQVPGATTAAGHTAGQARTYPECKQSCFAAPRSFPLPPKRTSQSASHPTAQGPQHFRRLTEPEIVSPTPHIRSQRFYRGLDADALGLSCNLPDSLLKPLQSLRRDNALHLWADHEAEPQEFSLLRSRYRALCLIHLEFELVRDEMRNALHHPSTRTLAANVDITIIRIANETKPTTP